VAWDTVFQLCEKDLQDELRRIFPKLNDRVKFIFEVNKLEHRPSAEAQSIRAFSQPENLDNSNNNESFSDSQLPLIIDEEFSDMHTTAVNLTVQATTDVEDGDHNSIPEEELIAFKTEPKLPDNYELPELSTSLRELIDNGDISKLGGHTNHRGQLMNAIYEDVTNKYKIE